MFARYGVLCFALCISIEIAVLYTEMQHPETVWYVSYRRKNILQIYEENRIMVVYWVSSEIPMRIFELPVFVITIIIRVSPDILPIDIVNSFRYALSITLFTTYLVCQIFIGITTALFTQIVFELLTMLINT